jgi:serine/threonine protein kinase
MLQVCEQCDVWSMGVVMWEMVTLEVPFSELTAQQIMMGLMQGSLHLQIPQDCEPEWQGLISLCMEPSPSKRPTFRELAAHLDMLNRSLMPAPPQPQPLLVQQQPQQQQLQFHQLVWQPSHPQQQQPHQEQRALAAVAALADVHMVQQQQQRQQHAAAAHQLASVQAHAIAQLQEQNRQAQQAAAATTAMLMAFQQQHHPPAPQLPPLQLPLPLFP